MRLRDVFGERCGNYYTLFPIYVLLLRNGVSLLWALLNASYPQPYAQEELVGHRLRQ